MRGDSTFLQQRMPDGIGFEELSNTLLYETRYNTTSNRKIAAENQFEPAASSAPCDISSAHMPAHPALGAPLIAARLSHVLAGAT